VGLDVNRYAAGRLLFVGRQWERKGGPILLEAFKRVRQEVPHATLTIAGAAIDPPDQDGVIYLGHVSNRRIAKLFAEASCFAMPAKCETWGLVYTEAAAAGLPIVGFNAWAMPDIVVDGHSGILVDEQSVGALADGLIRLLQDPEQMLQMGRAARKRMREVLDWPHVADRLLARFIPEAMDGREPQWMNEERWSL
jgi:glycosyltransferase involved in cell wall biosynthesis